MFRSTIFLGILALLPFSAPAHSAEAQESVCGVDLSQVTTFSWPSFRQGSALNAFIAGDRNAVNLELRGLLADQAVDWPDELTSIALNRFDKFVIGTIASSDFRLRKKAHGNGIQEELHAFPGKLEFWFPWNEDGGDCANSQTMKNALPEFARFILLVERSEAENLADARKLVGQSIIELERTYDKYLFEGFPMFPWEAAINSWFLTDRSIANGPPKWQLAVLHPSAGINGHVASGTDGDVSATLLIEPIGFVRYNESYDRWFGVSIMASFPTDREPGIGLSLNYNHFKLGVTWHNDPDGRYDGTAVFLGVELYQFANKQFRKYNGYKKRVTDIFKKSKMENGAN